MDSRLKPARSDMPDAGRPSAIPTPLRRMVRLRWFEIAALATALLIAGYPLEMTLPYGPLWGILAVMVLLNLVTHGQLVRTSAPAGRAVLVHLTLDVLTLSALLYFTGGAVNPFVSLLLVPLIIAATTLPLIEVGIMTAVALGAYSILMVVNVALPPVAHGPLDRLDTAILALLGADFGHTAHSRGHGFGLHVFGMWLNFVISATLIALFIAQMAAALRRRDAALSRAREDALRNEQILALGTLAAGAAHRLGTPLTTMVVILNERRIAHSGDAALDADMALLEQLVRNCKTILSEILCSAGQARSESGTLVALDQLVTRTLEQWRVIRPSADIELDLDTGTPAPDILADRTLEQALLNLLDNAADASPVGLALRCRWSSREGVLEILDRGRGIDATIAQRIGQAFFSTKKAGGGLGIGMFLSNATIERFGGRVELSNRPEGGACTRICLPLAVSAS